MTKAPPKLTKIQSKALDFIRSSLERSGTAPTLRELCAHMGYSAIGSAQDLVAALRRKGFLHTPDKQSARSLVLTQKAIALHEPVHQSTDTTYVVHGLERLASNDPFEINEERVGTLRISIGMFQRPYPAPEKLFAYKASDDSMLDVGILNGDWLLIHTQSEAEPGDMVLVRADNEVYVRRMLQDRNGWYLRSENVTYPIIRAKEDENFTVIGKVLAVQRVI
jgi:repressor LexA